MKTHDARRITVIDDLVSLGLNSQGGDQTRQQRFRPAGLRVGGGKGNKNKKNKEKKK
jgi:hypothetical protein